MTTVGAELSTLITLHKTFLTKAQEALDIKNSVDHGIENAIWTGKFSQQFHTAWTEYRRNLDNLNVALTGAADDVRTNHNNIAAATGEPERI
jgi:uncharacterized protein YukE